MVLTGAILSSAFLLDAAAAEITVSPEGISPKEAIEKIRAAKKAGDKSAWTVRVKSGTYEIKETLIFKPEDSGTIESPVRWIGEDGAVFAGGKAIDGWRDLGNGVWEAPIPKDDAGNEIFFESLYVNDVRAVRSYLPRKGFFKMRSWRQQELKGPDGKPNGKAIHTAAIKGDGLKVLEKLSPKALQAAKWRAFVKWTHEWLSIDAYNAKTGEVTIKGVKLPHYRRWIGDSHDYVQLENIEEGFKEPGEWFYDAERGTVKYRPRPGEKISSIKAIAPTSRLVSLIRFEGDVEKGEFVHDIEFEGIGFTATRSDGVLASNGAVNAYSRQAANMVGGTISGVGLHRVRFEFCRVFNTENYAFRFGEGSVSNAIVSCEIVDAGGGGVWLGEAPGNLFLIKKLSFRPPGKDAWDCPLPTKVEVDTSPRAVRFNVIDNNLIRRCGRVAPDACGIIATHAADTKITHNDISDLYYTGISVGWTWGYWGSYAQRNEVSFNRIENIGQYRMADMGGVYTLGTSYGTVVTNNVIMNVKSSSYGGWGMYNDEGSEGIHWENNLVVDTSADSYHIHFGRSNTVANCIMVNGGTSKLCVSREEKHHQTTFSRNIIYWPEGPVYVRHGWNKLRDGLAKVIWDNNLFWCTSGFTELNGPTSGVIADPLFVNPSKGDWRLRSDSPALKLGFKPWDYSLSGRRKNEVRTRTINAPSADGDGVD